MIDNQSVRYLNLLTFKFKFAMNVKNVLLEVLFQLITDMH